MSSSTINHDGLKTIRGKTAIVTGAAGGIGSHIVKLFAHNGANVVLSDLEYSRSAAEALISSLPDPTKAIFVPTNIIDWNDMKQLFKQTVAKFGSVEFVVANAGVMESASCMNMDDVDENGELKEATEVSKVIDINLKGTLNTIRLAMFHMKENGPSFPDKSRGSIVLISSTSGYFGTTGVAGYISSKHGITGLLRASQIHAAKLGIHVNGVAPFFTPTLMVKGFTEAWIERGLPRNTPEGVAEVIVALSADSSQRGACYLACGSVLREIEHARVDVLPQWLGEDATTLMRGGGQLFQDIGGYPYPKLTAMKEATSKSTTS
ncbi:hypothetical protein FDECE_11901 [Fusarium decemcellulare]|nr:hypothetical protein FDECE_11901 [Fusarium decemcellulare]